ncbi:MAG: DUF1631 domain-containing protein [Gammaproteobacteria bacterium]|nr:MAG: DUF1631 domain-containing protein [Gammaproteobacteria bacterium]
MKRQSFITDKDTQFVSTRSRSLPKLLIQVRDKAVAYLMDSLARMLSGADDHLFDLAERAGNDKDQTQYFDSMRALRIKRKAVESAFRRRLEEKFDELTTHSDTEATQDNNLERIRVDQLQLVQEEQLEEDLAVENMVKKVRADCKEQLEALTRRMDAVVTHIPVTQENNPVDPVAIANAFRQAASCLELEIRAKLVVYKLFERMVMVTLGDLYAELNEYLAQHGILPDLAMAAPQRRQSHRSSKGSSDRARHVTNDAGGEGHESSEILEALHELLTVARRSAGMSSENSPVGNSQTSQNVAIDADTLVSALGSVQAQAPVITSPQALRQQIGQVLPTVSGGQPVALGQVNEDVIDVIAMLFEFILGDKNLPDEMKAIIGRLQIPMLKVAIIDKTFFSKSNHPARKLLNEMAQAGLGWDPARAGQNGGLKPKMEAIVNRILEEFDDDTSIFEELLEEFRAFMDELERRAKRIEERTKQAEEGRAKAELAKREVMRTLHECIAGRELPEAVRRLLFNGWKNVLFLAYLKEGPDSAHWSQAVAVVQDLLMSLTPPQSLEGRKTLTARLPHLIQKIRSGLEAASFGQLESEELLHQLEKLHLRVLKGEDLAPVKSQTSAPKSEGGERLADQEADHRNVETDREAGLGQDLKRMESVEEILDHDLEHAPETVATTLSESTSEDDLPSGDAVVEEIELSDIEGMTGEVASLPEDDKYLMEVDLLRSGTWFEMTRDGNKTRCKLAAIIPTVDRYVFVSRTGTKVADYTRAGLAIAMRRGEMRPLEDGALFDRALESVIANLRALKSKSEEYT